jgi:hypothetical protein
MKEEFIHSRNDISLVKIKGASVCMVTTDEQGKIRLLGFDGSVKKINVGNFSSSHFFSPVDFDGNGGVDFVFYDNRNLSRYDSSGKMFFSKSLEGTADQIPSVLKMYSEKIIEINSTTENWTILVRKDGSIFDGFQPGNYSLPVVGSFDGNGLTISLLVATKDGFLANYQLLKK